MGLPRFAQGINSAPKKLVAAIAFATGSSLAFSQGLVLEEVVVTATKKDEMLQDIPSTVNVVTGESLDNFNVFNFKDVETLTPGLSLTSVDTRNSTVSMRGISFDPESRTAAAVNVYINAVPVRAPEAFQQIYDLSRIEVLRGPQGTLQGETSPAGSIQLYTKRANVDVMEGEVAQTFSDNSGSNTQIAASLPLIEGVLGIRVAGQLDDAETGVETADGRTGTRDTKSGRFSMSFLPTDNLDMHLTYQYLEARADAFEIVEGQDKNPANGNPPLDYEDRTALTENGANTFSRVEFSSLEVNYAVADHLVTWLTGYQEFKNFSFLDMDAGNGIPNYSRDQFVNTAGHRINQELRLTNTDAEFWEYTAGLFYNFQDIYTTADDRREAYLNFGGPNVIAPVGNTVSEVPTLNESVGVFLDNTFYLSDTTRLSVGTRWSKIRNISEIDTYAGSDGLNLGGGVVLPPGTFLASSIPKSEQVQKFIAWTGGIKLSHDLNEETMVYTSFDRSFRPGGFVISPNASELQPDDLIFDAETSNSLELGFKSTLENGRYQINGAVFYQEFTDYISRARNIFIDSTGDGFADKRIDGGLTYNSDAIIRGAELEFNGVITENWTAFLGASYTDSKFDGGEQPCGNAGLPSPVGTFQTCSTDGRTGPEPNWSLSASSEYTVPMGEVDGFVRGLYKFTDNRADNTVGTNVGGYGLFDVYLGLRDVSGQWEVSLWSKNLFDKDARTAIGTKQDLPLVTGGSTGNYTVVSVTPERTIGLTARYKFGNF